MTRFGEANLTGAYLGAANLTRAYLGAANLTGATLNAANLSGADLRTASGLSKEQLDQTDGDATTQLPKGVLPPDHWRSAEPPESSSETGLSG
jgi:uncharacterized protein YjbI with pentapeptide repeats